MLTMWNTMSALKKRVLHFVHLNIRSLVSKVSEVRLIAKNSNAAVIGLSETGRRTAFSLMGVGFHGTNGQNPKTNMHLYRNYVIPRFFYELEVVTLSAVQMSRLTQFHLSVIRSLQSFPSYTATPAVYLLAGILPIEGLLHLRMLSLLGMIFRSENHTLINISLRQSTKPSNSKSWFAKIATLLIQYNLPSILEVAEAKLSKNIWKKQCKQAVCGFWSAQLKEKASSMSTLDNLNIRSGLARTEAAK